ncbi:unnamed protein product (macronuclear) [Paramecium tetraurelia]|uniref:Transmembrane protein n=1 Tax=Paramecium tetraurelia TaxID=5888 RepID=A0CMC0_PARTE|nr:uncharacterized protein GSPATT00008416001 [Paramecium tetraurelia]CAK71937.1 unnamed protein product [Paramecium tetraurelia]|eukprot:XP_001439334.1 hypothetical protein (macronuclear) [Paramecium tetraurelia strain d4-2]
MIRNLIKKADLLVDPYEFNISQKEKSLTPIGFIQFQFLGGFISMLLLIFTSFYIVGVFQRSIQNQNTIYAGTESDKNTQFILSNENTIFSIELSTLDGKILNNNTNVKDYFTLTAQYIQQQRVEGKIGFTRNYSSLNQSKCSTDKVQQFNFNSASMTEEQKENLICFDGDFKLQGQFYEPYFAYIKLTISVCNNSTSKTCKTSKEIESFINKGVNVDMFIKGSKIKQSLNSSSPADIFSTNIFWRLTTGIGDNEDIYMQPLQMDLSKIHLNNQEKIQFFSDIFNIENSERLYNGSVVQRQERRQEPISINSGVGLCTFYLRASSDTSFYFVIQQDMPSIILSAVSEATALFLAVMQIVKIFYRVYNQHKTFEILMNSVFKFDLKSVQKRKQSYVNQQSQTPGKMQSSVKNTKKLLQQILDYTINYSFSQYIFYIIRKYFKSCKKNIEDEKELVISQIAKSKIEFDLDLTNILKKLYEIDCLKLFLFDDDQLLLFNSFCSPVFQDQMTDQKELFDILTASKQNKSINQLQLNQAHIDNNQNIIKYAATSTIPINVRLAKLTRFFKAQLGAENAQDLVDNFQKITENKNKNWQLNHQLMQFAMQNKSLFNLVQQNYTTNLQQQNEDEQKYLEDQIRLDVPNELEEGRKNSEVVGSKESGQSLKDLEIHQSPDCLQNRLQQP